MKRTSVIVATAAGTGSAAAAMVYAGLPEGPSLLPYLFALVAMTAMTGLIVGAAGRKEEAPYILIGLVAGQVVGAMAVVIATLFPPEPPIEELLSALSLGAPAFGGMAIVIGLVIGPISVSVGRLIGERLSPNRDGLGM